MVGQHALYRIALTVVIDLGRQSVPITRKVTVTRHAIVHKKQVSYYVIKNVMRLISIAAVSVVHSSLNS